MGQSEKSCGVGEVKGPLRLFGDTAAAKPRPPSTGDNCPNLKKCVIRNRRCRSHRSDVITVKEMKKEFVKKEDDEVCLELREVEREVCVAFRKLRMETLRIGSTDGGKSI